MMPSVKLLFVKMEMNGINMCEMQDGSCESIDHLGIAGKAMVPVSLLEGMFLYFINLNDDIRMLLLGGDNDDDDNNEGEAVRGNGRKSKAVQDW